MRDYNNSLFLVVQNDGNGSQCGTTYKDRLRVAMYNSHSRRKAAWRLMVDNACQWHKVNGYEPFTPDDKINAVDTLDSYYIQHLKEGARP